MALTQNKLTSFHHHDSQIVQVIRLEMDEQEHQATVSRETRFIHNDDLKKIQYFVLIFWKIGMQIEFQKFP
jgi:hypothetical protein